MKYFFISFVFAVIFIFSCKKNESTPTCQGNSGRFVLLNYTIDTCYVIITPMTGLSQNTLEIAPGNTAIVNYNTPSPVSYVVQSVSGGITYDTLVTSSCGGNDTLIRR